MCKILLLPILFLVFPLGLRSQITPRDGGKLNYRLIYFSFPATGETTKYTLEIADGNYYREDSFSKNIINKYSAAVNEIVSEVPYFGASYTWRVISTNKRSGGTKSPLYHFSTLIIPEADTAAYRLKVTVDAKVYKDAYVFIDANRALYDMAGNAVWFLPYTDSSDIAPRDLKMTPKGTITFIAGNTPYEVNYEGEILWKGPNTGAVNGDTSEYYHHEVTRLSNGHYMVLGTENMFVKLPTKNDSSMRFIPMVKMFRGGKNSIFRAAKFGTVIEYDEQGNVVWSWRSSKYFSGGKVEQFGSPEQREKLYSDVHENAFCFDENGGHVYVSFKNINLILKVKYPEGKVEAEYAQKYDSSYHGKPNHLFCGQHSIALTGRGNLITFNNNDCNPLSPAEIVMLKEPGSKNDKLKKIWVYKCLPDTSLQDRTMNDIMFFKSTVGGNVIPLPDQSIFACMSSYDCRVIIVNMNKEILWCALPEKWSAENGKWEANSNSYRASIILNKKELIPLIKGQKHADK